MIGAAGEPGSSSLGMPLQQDTSTDLPVHQGRKPCAIMPRFPPTPTFMTPSPTPHDPGNPHPIYTDDEINLTQLLHALWRYRWVVVVLGVLGVLAGAWTSLSSTNYVSQGLFLTPGLSIAGYKQYESALGSEPRLHQFLKLNALEGTHSAKLLEGVLKRPGALSDAVRPVFAITGKDAKVYDIKTEDGGIVGIQLTLERGEKTEKAPVFALAEYLRSTMIELDFKDLMLNQCLDHQTKEQELRNEQIAADFSVRQQQSRADNLRTLIANTPGASNIDNRQVVSVENGGERFLSPTAQLVAAEIGISDMKIAEVARERNRVATALNKDFYCRAHDAQAEPMTGQNFFAAIKDIHAEVFKGQDLTKDIVEQTANALDIQRQSWTNKYLQRTRFVVSPEGAERRVRKPGLTMGVLVGGILGGLLGVMLALFLAWWHDNRDAVLAEDEN